MIEVTPYREEYRKGWHDFVRQAPLGTCFHEVNFLEYHPAGRFEWHHLFFGNPSHPVAVLPAAIVADRGRRSLRSPAGATFGGLVLRPESSVHQIIEVVDACVNYAHAQDLAELSMGTIPAIYVDQPDETLEFVLQNAGFHAVPQLCFWVDLQQLDGDEHAIVNTLPSNSRRAYRKSLKQGLRMELAVSPEDTHALYDVLVANKARHGAIPAHSLDEIRLLKEILGNRLSLYVARHEGTIVAFVYCIQVNDRVCYTQYIADAPDRRDLEATRFLLLSMLPHLRDRGIHRLDLGPSLRIPVQSTDGARFKESLGARGCYRRQWTLTL